MGPKKGQRRKTEAAAGAADRPGIASDRLRAGASATLTRSSTAFFANAIGTSSSEETDPPSNLNARGAACAAPAAPAAPAEADAFEEVGGRPWQTPLATS
jgi:hypothetical protein